MTPTIQRYRVIVFCCALVAVVTSVHLILDGYLKASAAILFLSSVGLWGLLFDPAGKKQWRTTMFMSVASFGGFVAAMNDHYLQGLIVILICCVVALLINREKQSPESERLYNGGVIDLEAGMNHDYTDRKYHARAFTMRDVDEAIIDMDKDIRSGEQHYKRDQGLSSRGSQKLNRDKLLLAALKEWRKNQTR